MTTAVSDNDAFVMPSIVGSFFAHVALLIATAAAVAPLRVVDDTWSRSVPYWFVSEPIGWADPSTESARTVLVEAEQFGMTGLPGATQEGSMGELDGPWHDHRQGVRGPRENPDAHIARDRGMLDAPWLSSIGLQSYAFGDPHAPVAPWGSDDSLGEDSKSARGHFWGVAIGDAASDRGGIQGDGGESGYGDGSGIPFTSYVHHCRLQ